MSASSRPFPERERAELADLLEGPTWLREQPLMAAYACLPVLTAVAILRYRLYELDLVVKKTVLYAVVALLFMAAFSVFAILVGRAVIEANPQAKAVYDESMRESWAAKNRLLALGVPLELAGGARVGALFGIGPDLRELAARHHALFVFAVPFLLYMYFAWAGRRLFGWQLPQPQEQSAMYRPVRPTAGRAPRRGCGRWGSRWCPAPCTRPSGGRRTHPRWRRSATAARRSSRRSCGVRPPQIPWSCPDRGSRPFCGPGRMHAVSARVCAPARGWSSSGRGGSAPRSRPQQQVSGAR